MTEIILDKPQVISFVGEGKSAGVAERVRMHRSQPGPRGGSRAEIVHGLPSEWLASFGEEQPRQGILTTCEIASKSTQFVTGNGLLDRQSALEASHP